MSRFRKEYDQQSFAFDLARLYTSGIEETKSFAENHTVL